MQLKILQLNTWAGTHFDKIEDFITKNDFDILCLQEIAGPNSHVGNLHSSEDQFLKFQQLLQNTHYGEMAIATRFSSDPINSYDANAIFYKKDFSLTHKDVLTLTKGIDPFPSSMTTYEENGRNTLRLTLTKDEKIVDVISAHLAWAPTHSEQPHQRAQNKHLIAYIQELKNPFLLAGDFNIDPEQPTILDLEKYTQDLTKEYNVANTIDPVYHHAWEKLAPGFPVDYIFVSPSIRVIDFTVLDTIHLSDHFGLTAVVEI